MGPMSALEEKMLAELQRIADSQNALERAALEAAGSVEVACSKMAADFADALRRATKAIEYATGAIEDAAREWHRKAQR
jgi:hypothetical protein